jgi:hypothetical protein
MTSESLSGHLTWRSNTSFWNAHPVLPCTTAHPVVQGNTGCAQATTLATEPRFSPTTMSEIYIS